MPEFIGSFPARSSRSQGGVQRLLRIVGSRLRVGIVAVGQCPNRGSLQCEDMVDHRGVEFLDSYQTGWLRMPQPLSPFQGHQRVSKVQHVRSSLEFGSRVVHCPKLTHGR